MYSEWVAKYKYDGKKLTIYNDKWNKVEYDLEVVSENELLCWEGLGRGIRRVLGTDGQVAKDGPAGDGRRLRSGDPKPGLKDPSSADPPRLELASGPQNRGQLAGGRREEQGR